IENDDLYRHEETSMTADRTTARWAGFFYLVMGLPAYVNLMVLPAHVLVRGDAGRTAENIRAGEGFFRLATMGGFVSSAGFLILAALLYRLLAPVDRQLAALLVVFVAVSVAIGF